MELLAGEPNYVTEVKEHGITYKLDFSKVIYEVPPLYFRLGFLEHSSFNRTSQNRE